MVLVGCGPSEAELAHDAWLLDGAVQNGHIDVVKHNIAIGIDVNSKNEAGSSPLHSSAYWGYKEIAELLIAEGADVNAKCDNGYTALDEAIQRKHSETANLLRKHGGKSGAEDSVHVAAGMGNIEAVKQHLAAGADVNAKDELIGRTPLHEAASRGHKEIAELLISGGADVNARPKFGRTPLDLAISRKHPETSDLIRKNGGKTRKELKAEGK